MGLEWSDDYLVGIDSIDDQHKSFFGFAKRLHRDLSSKQEENCIRESFAFLKDYTIMHFHDEEVFMRDHAYPYVEDHVKLHKDFLEKYDALVYQFQGEGPSEKLADTIARMIQSWFSDHIAQADRDYAWYLKKHPQLV